MSFRALCLGSLFAVGAIACGRSAPYDEVIFDGGKGGGGGGVGGGGGGAGGGGGGGAGGGGGGGGGGATCATDAGCVIDPIFKSTTCRGQPGVTSVTFSGTDRGLAVLDMKRLGEVGIEADFCDPVRYTFSIGDSPTNNGHCGDGASRDHDAELWVLDGRVGICESDLGSAGGRTKATWDFPGPALIGCSTLHFRVRDGALDYADQNQRLVSQFLFRFGQPDREGGGPDWDLYLGLNQVPAGDRTGSGLRRVRLDLGACR